MINRETLLQTSQRTVLISNFCIFRSEAKFREEDGADNVLATAKDYLLQGLMDENKELR